MPSLIPLATQPRPLIIDYGIAHAPDFYTLSELVKSQIKKGFQPCTESGVKAMQHGDTQVFVQVMVKYAAAINSIKPKTKKQCLTKQK